MASRYATFRSLSWSERWLLFQALVLLATIGLCLRVSTFDRVHNTLGNLLPPGDEDGARGWDPAPERVVTLSRMVEMASRHTPLPTTCLHRSLALWWLLGRRGLESRLRFGVRNNAGRFQAHSWVEHRGTVINDHPTVGRDYVPLADFPAKNVRFPS